MVHEAIWQKHKPGEMRSATRISRTILSALLLSSSGLFGLSPIRAADGYLISDIAVVGDRTPIGGQFWNFSQSSPPLNNEKQVVFEGMVSGGDVGMAIFLSEAGSLSAIVIPGDPVPGGGQILGTASPALGDDGTVAFFADVEGGDAGTAILGWNQGRLTSYVKSGDSTPLGGTIGEIFLLSTSRGAINGSGEVVLRATIVGGAAPEALFVGDGTSLRVVAALGDPTPVGGTFSTFELGEPAINDLGDVVFWAEVAGGTASEGLFLNRGGVFEKVVASGEPTPVGGVYDTFLFTGGAFPSSTDAGEIAFGAFIDGGTADHAILKWKDGSVSKVVAEGELSPLGCPFLSLEQPTINAGKQVAFRGFSCGLLGLFVARGLAIDVVVSVLDRPPPGGHWSLFSTPLSFNDSSDMGFWAAGGPWGSGVFVATRPTLIFADGFESGGMDAWSGSVP